MVTEMKILERTDNEIRFVFEGNPQLANALRRIAAAEVPALAVDDVDFIENDSMFYDEVIAHRLGLLPLTFDSKAMNLKEECKCEGKGCSLCTVVLVLDKKGPCIVRAGDIKSSDKTVRPAFPNIPIVELQDGEKLKLEATAVLGTGRNHAKWQAAVAYYQFYPVLEKAPEPNEKYVEICPKHALKIEGGKLVLTEACNFSRECEKLGLKVTGDKNKFIFTVETVSGMKPEEIFLKALDVLEKKAKEFERLIGKLE